MPNKKSAFKRLKTSEKARALNKSRKSALKTVEKKFRDAVAAGDEKSTELLREITSLLDKATKGGVIHRNKANRKKVQLSTLLNQAKTGAKEEAAKA